jgi:ABC-type branched-subunit amino acid transport system substrate-binding protein
MPESENALRAYDAAYIIFEGIKIANSAEPTAIRDGIASIKDLQGLAGVFDFTAFDGTGEGIGIQRLYAWSGGKAILLEEYLANQS